MIIEDLQDLKKRLAQLGFSEDVIEVDHCIGDFGVVAWIPFNGKRIGFKGHTNNEVVQYFKDLLHLT